MKPSELIDKQIAGLPDWRGRLFTQLRKLINEAYPQLKEEVKWGTAVWTHKGMVCALGAFKDHLKFNFFQGAALTDSHKLFNSGFDAKKTRTIDFKEGDMLNEPALKELIREAITYNTSSNFL